RGLYVFRPLHFAKSPELLSYGIELVERVRVEEVPVDPPTSETPGIRHTHVSSALQFMASHRNQPAIQYLIFDLFRDPGEFRSKRLELARLISEELHPGMHRED